MLDTLTDTIIKSVTYGPHTLNSNGYAVIGSLGTDLYIPFVDKTETPFKAKLSWCDISILEFCTDINAVTEPITPTYFNFISDPNPDFLWTTVASLNPVAMLSWTHSIVEDTLPFIDLSMTLTTLKTHTFEFSNQST